MAKLFVLIALTALFASTLASCPITLAENAVSIAKVAVEAQGGDYEGIPELVAGLGKVCSQCNLQCGFLKDLSDAAKTGGDAAGCISGIADSFEGVAQAAGTGGLDIFGDVELVYGVYRTIKSCEALIKDVKKDQKDIKGGKGGEESSGEHSGNEQSSPSESSTESSSTETSNPENNAEFQEWAKDNSSETESNNSENDNSFLSTFWWSNALINTKWNFVIKFIYVVIQHWWIWF